MQKRIEFKIMVLMRNLYADRAPTISYEVFCAGAIDS